MEDYFELKEAVTNPHILYHYDATLLLWLETDASMLGFDSLLYQVIRGRTTIAQRSAEPCRREMTGLKMATNHFHKTLLGTPFSIVTDNMGVFHLFKRAEAGKLPQILILNRYLNVILLYPVKNIIHKTTKEVFTSDAMSRSVWMQLATNENDPSIVIQCKIQGFDAKEFNKLTRKLVHHFRHETCPFVYLDRGHPAIGCVILKIRQFSKLNLRNALINLHGEARLVKLDSG